MRVTGLGSMLAHFLAVHADALTLAEVGIELHTVAAEIPTTPVRAVPSFFVTTMGANCSLITLLGLMI